jgi:hypothetical protein
LHDLPEIRAVASAHVAHVLHPDDELDALLL